MDIRRLVLNSNKIMTAKIFLITAIIIIVILIIIWMHGKVTLEKSNCKKMNMLYKKFPPLSNTTQTENRLRDYYVKTAYNCCAPGTYNHNFVNLCALKNCIKQGVRCLDFQIYSVDNLPVVAVSSVSDFNIKGSYNNIPFSSAMRVVADYAFSGSTCPCPDDPMILHFRIMTNNLEILKRMSTDLQTTLKRRLIGKVCSYECHGRNIGEVVLKELVGKVIIAVDKSLANPSKTLLDEYVNITSNSAFMRAIRYRDVKYTPDINELIEFNKKYMTLCLPDLESRPKNPSSALVMKYGCQHVAMCMQKNDSNLKYYNNLFNEAGCAFVKKPVELLYKPKTITIPDPPPPEHSYQDRDVKSDFYSFKI